MGRGTVVGGNIAFKSESAHTVHIVGRSKITVYIYIHIYKGRKFQKYVSGLWNLNRNDKHVTLEDLFWSTFIIYYSQIYNHDIIDFIDCYVVNKGWFCSCSNRMYVWCMTSGPMTTLWRHYMERLSEILGRLWGKPPVTGGSPHKGVIIWCFGDHVTYYWTNSWVVGNFGHHRADVE